MRYGSWTWSNIRLYIKRKRKMKNNRVLLTILILAVVAAISIAIMALTRLDGFSLYDIFDYRYVATVKGEKVSVGEFKLMLDTVGPRMEKVQGKKPTDIVGGKKFKDFEKEAALNSIINYKIGAQKAKERGIYLTNDEINKINSEIDNMISQNPKAKENLKRIDLSKNEFKKVTAQIRLAAKLKEKVYDEVKSKLTVSDSDAKVFYDKNEEQYTEDFNLIKEKVRFDVEYNKILDGWKKQSTIEKNDSVYNSI